MKSHTFQILGLWGCSTRWRFYIIYPNGASGVGIVSSKDIAGPYIDPVGKLLVGGGGVTDCGGISWCFDPAIFVDDDGKRI